MNFSSTAVTPRAIFLIRQLVDVKSVTSLNCHGSRGESNNFHGPWSMVGSSWLNGFDKNLRDICHDLVTDLQNCTYYFFIC